MEGLSILVVRISWHLSICTNEHVAKPIIQNKVGFSVVAGSDLTISAGVAIAHYKTPLGTVVKRAQEMEHLAKRSGRNGFAVGVMKHSGGDLECKFKWGAPTNPEQILRDILKSLKEDFSSSFISKLQKINRVMGNGISDEVLTIILREAVSRSCQIENTNDKTNAIEKLLGLLKSLRSGCSMNEFTNTLLLCDFMNRKSDRD